MNKVLMSAALISSALTLASCGGGSGSTPSTSTTPTILYTTPSTGSLGNADTTKIVIKFSEAMDTLQTQGAYNSASVDIRQAFGEVTYSWSEGNTKLTIIPNNPLTYNIAPAAPRNYAYYISTAAKSAAGVNLAAQYNSNFNTYVKHLNEVQYSKFSEEYGGELGGTLSASISAAFPLTHIGDSTLNSTYTTWLTFDLGGLPSDLVKDNILSADLKVTQAGVPVGSPYTNLASGAAKLSIYSLVYGPTVDLLMPELVPSALLVSNLDGTIMNGDVLGAVKNDWLNRAAQGSRSQYQLRFAKPTNYGWVNDYIDIFSGDPVNTTNRPKLTLTYLSNN